MTTGFISRVVGETVVARPRASRRERHCIAGLALCAATSVTTAAQVGLAGVVSGKAVLIIDGNQTRTVSVGQRTPEGVRLVAIENGGATIEVDGSRQTLRLGQNASGQQSGQRQTAVLQANQQGQFLTTGSINGFPVRFMVDTGATLVSIGASEGRRLGIESSAGESLPAQTANGMVMVKKVRLSSVVIGGISLDSVEALVLEGDLPYSLLGMSFLGRTDIENESGRMTLKKRY